MKHVPTRTCIVCRESKQKSELIRTVKKADGSAVLDVTGREPGRGCYVCKSGDCMEQAIKKRLFNRAYKESLPQSFYDGLQTQYSSLGDNGK